MRHASLPAIAAALILAHAGTADAQNAQLGIDQVATGGGDAIETDQVSRERRRIDLPQRPVREAAPAPQLSERAAGTPTQAQLTSRGESAAPAAQLYRGGRTAQPSAPLSSPSEGRTAAVSRVEGRDRCDPEAAERTGPDACARVIETRSAEFTRPDPAQLSPEQRLLAEQRLQDTNSPQAAVRRLASNAADPNAPEEQGIASIVLRDARPAPVQREEEEPAEDAAITEAIVAAITQQPPQN